jgi:hypothetical protein
MPGSLLVFSDGIYGLGYTAIPTATGYYMNNVSVKITMSDSVDGFYNCANLTNCTCTGNGAYGGIGFQSCINITNCAGTGICTSSGIGYGYYTCKGMILNKSGNSASTTATYGDSYVSISGSGAALADSAAGIVHRRPEIVLLISAAARSR